MNKDVIYIEPEQDITDILANIKASKHKIIALVPPKKAGVLRSAVNFKLIAKTARQNEKTVVLITVDEALRRLANTVAMPTAKSLQSKPQLPQDDDAKEFGEDDKVDAPVDDDEKEDEETETEKEPVDDALKGETDPKSAAKKIPVTAAVKVAKKKSAAEAADAESKPVEEKPKAAKEDDVIEGEPEPAEEKEPQTKAEKAAAKMKGAKIPNFAKYRKYIILGVVLVVVITAFSIWANIFAPYAKISVKVHTTARSFSEKVTFVDDALKAEPKKGVLLLETKTITKSDYKDFVASGQVDKGEKATGKVTITRPAKDIINDTTNLKFIIAKGATFTINGKEFITTEDMDLSASDKSLTLCGIKACTLSAITKTVSVVAKEVGDSYNVAAATKGITCSTKIPSNYTITSTSMTGGSSKVVTIVSSEDIENAAGSIDMPSQKEISDELANEFGENYVFLGSLEQSEAKITSSPALNEEVGDNVTPRVVKEIVYTMRAVPRADIKAYLDIAAKDDLHNAEKGGDDTQTVYDSGADRAFFEAFRDNAAKLKTTYKSGPRVTDEEVRKKCYGAKVGECQSRLKSMNGVTSAKIDTSYFFVMSIPSDDNKVEVNIENEE